MSWLVEDLGGRHRLELVEVKATSNNAWFASIENLRQLRLFKESTESRTLFEKPEGRTEASFRTFRSGASWSDRARFMPGEARRETPSSLRRS